MDSLVDPETDHDTGFDGELLQRNKRASDLRRSTFGIVHGDNHGERTDTHTSDKSSSENR